MFPTAIVLSHIKCLRLVVTKIIGILEQVSAELESAVILSDTKAEESIESKVPDESEPEVPVSVCG